MFDDPGKALRRIEEELRAAEQPEGEASTPTRAEGFGRTVYADEVLDEEAALIPGQEKGRKKKEKKDKKNKKKKGILRRVIGFLLNILILLAILEWWLR